MDQLKIQIGLLDKFTPRTDTSKQEKSLPKIDIQVDKF